MSSACLSEATAAGADVSEVSGRRPSAANIEERLSGLRQQRSDRLNRRCHFDRSQGHG